MEALRETTLFGTWDKVQMAIERLRTFCPPEGYYLAFSGGKDSQTIYHLAKMAGVRFTAYYNVTTVDPPELLRFIHQHYPDVIWGRPERTMWRLIELNGLPMRRKRLCCKYLKEIEGHGRIVVTGVRWQESASRSRRKMVETCMNDPSKWFVNPIIDWSEANVWEFLNENNLPHCVLYDQGFRRIGCILCPMKDGKDRLVDAQRWPRYYALYERAAQRRIEHLRAEGREPSWRDGADAMRWWLSEPEKQPTQDMFPGIMEEEDGSD